MTRFITPKVATALLLACVAGTVSAAQISGVKWLDDNKDGVMDPGEQALPGWTIFADQNSNKTYDQGEPFAVTDGSGAYTITGLEPGTVNLYEVPQEGFYQTFPTPATKFNIEIVFPDNSLTASQKLIFEQAAARWSQLIVGDIPDVGDIDDLQIEASGPYIDGVGNILGQAGPDQLRIGSYFPVSGVMQFDSADLADLENDGELDEVILHEMGHVLGIGTIWGYKNLLVTDGTPNFRGVDANREYKQIFSATNTLPVEDGGGAGTALSHWEEDVLDNELMTGYLNSGRENPLSRITVGSLSDLGYRVNIGAADPYTKPSGKSQHRHENFCRILPIKPKLVNPKAYRRGMKSIQAVDDQLAPQVVVLSAAGDDITNINFGNATYPPVFTPLPPPPSECVNDLLQDGGFELGLATPWDQTSTNFGTPLCDDSCGATARRGTYYAWFGGVDATEVGTLSQDVTIPTGTTELNYYLSVYSDGGSANDYLSIQIDGNELVRYTANDTDDYPDWTQVTIDVTGYADGGSHTLLFYSSITGLGTDPTSFFVDDVSICPVDSASDTMTIH